MKRLLALCLLAVALPALAQDPAAAPQCSCPCECPEPEPPKAGMKWHPGHYMTLDGAKTSPELRLRHFREIDAIAKDPTIRGVKLWLYWGAVEKAEGDYSAGFAILDAYLAKLKQHNKYLILSVLDRTFAKYAPADRNQIFPAYMVSRYGLTTGRNVETTRVWQQSSMDRYIAMVKAFGARYEPNPNFEMLQAEETALAVPLGLDGYTLSAYGTQLKRLLIEARRAFPTTQVRLSANFFGSDTQMLELLRFCDQYDIAVGGPDVIPNQSIQANRLYDQYFRGKMIWVAEVQSPSLGGHKGTFTAQQIYDAAMKQQPAYFIWYRNTWSGGTAQRWDTGLLPYIRRVQGNVVSSCPLNVTCK